jgi:hypothetical protein
VIGVRPPIRGLAASWWARCFSDMPVPALCPVQASQLTLPSTGRLPSSDHTGALHEGLKRFRAVVPLLAEHDDGAVTLPNIPLPSTAR